MTPEQRAHKVREEIRTKQCWTTPGDVEAIVCHAIRSAENAALERAARGLANDLTGWMGGTPESYVRSLKSRAPRKAKQ